MSRLRKLVIADEESHLKAANPENQYVMGLFALQPTLEMIEVRVGDAKPRLRAKSPRLGMLNKRGEEQQPVDIDWDEWKTFPLIDGNWF